LSEKGKGVEKGSERRRTRANKNGTRGGTGFSLCALVPSNRLRPHPDHKHEGGEPNNRSRRSESKGRVDSTAKRSARIQSGGKEWLEPG